MADPQGPVVVVIGSAHVDLVARASRLPLRGETLPGDAFAIHAGGKGGNQAIAAARAGGRSRFIGRLGHDAFGDLLVASLSGAGVDLAWLGIDEEAATGCSTVLTGEDGDYASIIVPGSSLQLDAALVHASAAAFANAGAVIGQLEIEPGATAAAFDEGRRAGAVTLLNAAPAPSGAERLPRELLDLTDVLIVNRVEAAMLLGEDPDSAAADRSAFAGRLRSRLGVGAAVVTLGEAGLIAAHERGETVLPAHRVTPVDTLGAGDAFTGTLACSIAAGLDMESALLRANAAGAIAVTRAGGASAPTAAEVDAFIAAG